LKEGIYESYFANGQIKENGEYEKGKKNGVWEINYYGSLIKTIEYSNGKVVNN
jgi:antitoxin component YwqK of YwqJK toxin-antitoxin module